MSKIPQIMTKKHDKQANFYEDPAFQKYFSSARRSLIIKANPPHFTVLAVNDEFLRLTRKNREEVVNKNLFEVFPGSDSDDSQVNTVIDSLMRVIENKAIDILPFMTYEFENPETGKKELQYWSCTKEPVLDDKGDIIFLVCTVTDITEEVLSDIAVYGVAKQNTELTRARQQNEQLTNDNIEQKKLHQELKKNYEREEVLNEELLTANQKLHAINEELISTNEHLQVMHDHLVLTNIRLTDAEEKMRLTSEAANIGTFAIELKSGKLSVSQRTCEIFGLQPGEGSSFENFLALLDNTHRDRVAESINNSITLTDTPYFEEYAINRKNDGAKRWVRALGNKRIMGPDKILIFAGVLIDITEQKEEEQRKKDFVDMVGFKLKKPLTFLSALLQLLQMRTDSSDELILGLMEKANGQIVSMADIIDNFLNAFPDRKPQNPVRQTSN